MQVAHQLRPQLVQATSTCGASSGVAYLNEPPSSSAAAAAMPVDGGGQVARPPVVEARRARPKRWEWRDLPAAVTLIADLDWGTGDVALPLRGDVVFSPKTAHISQGVLEILCAHQPVYFKGEPRAAFVFHCADARTQEVCARRVMTLMLQMAAPAATILMHRVYGPKGDAAVLTIEWSARDAILGFLPRLMAADASFFPMVLRGSMGRDRMAYDARILKSFLTESGGIERHLSRTHTIARRFSDFDCRDTIFLGAGVTFDLLFDEPEIQQMAEGCLARVREAIERAADRQTKGKPFPLQSEFARTEWQENSFQDTDVWDQPCMTIRARWNGPRTRAAMGLFLSCLCAIAPEPPLLDVFRLSAKDLS